MRRLFQLQVQGLRLAGTVHSSEETLHDVTASSGQASSLGILILNTGYSPRSGRGDFSALLADGLATLGYPIFRMDLPGLGDSEGDIPVEVTDFFRSVQEGNNASCVAAMVEGIRSRFHIEQLVLLGNCAGAISALYMAAQDSTGGVAGLVLLEPVFDAIRSPCKPADSVDWSARLSTSLLARFRKTRLKFHNWLLKRPYGESVSEIYQKIRVFLRRFAARGLPLKTNLLLVGHWRSLAARGMPMLVFTAKVPPRGAPAFDYVGFLASESGATVFWHPIDGATHEFSESRGRQAVLQVTESWLKANFPRPVSMESNWICAT